MTASLPVVAITGATGFVGRALVQTCALLPNVDVLAITRRAHGVQYSELRGVQFSNIGELSSSMHWLPVLTGVDVLVHTAARVHVMRDTATDPLTTFRAVNVEGTMNLARQAAAVGVNRFVFISSVKVNGEETAPERPYTPNDFPAPVDPYGISKREAEDALRQLAAATGMEVVILRPPLVYGPGVKANFLSMMRWLYKGIPLPLGAINNKRSFVAIDNLVDLIVTCIDHPAAANQTFLVSDGEDISTTELLRRIENALGRPTRLIPVPEWMLRAGAALLGERELSQRLCGNLQVDISKTRNLLEWSPPLSVNEGLKATVEHYLAGLSK